MASKTSSGGISFLTALGLLFIGLKLAGVIHWSWWYVLLPLYGGIVIVVGFLLIAGIIALIASAATVVSKK